MGLFNYLKSLVGIATKSELENLLDHTLSSLSVLDSQVTLLLDSQIPNDTAEAAVGRLPKIYYKGIKVERLKDMETLVVSLSDNVRENVEYIAKELKGSGDISLKDTSIRMATLLTDLNNVDFFMDYTSDLIQVMVVSWMAQTEDFAYMLKESNFLEHKKRVVDDISRYIDIANTLAKDPKQYKKDIDALPELVIHSEEEEAMLKESGTIGLDHKGMEEFYYSPLHALSKFLADIAAKRYHKYKEELRELELYLAILDANENNLNIAVLEKELVLTQSRIDEYNYKISKEEE